MAHGLAADLLVLVHLAFVAFVGLGAVAVWRWPRLAWVHLPAVAWGVGIELTGTVCPLTPLEQWLRRQGGLLGYEEDFVAHYIVPIVYPAGLTSEGQWVLAGAVSFVNVAAYACLWRIRSNRSKSRM